MSESFLSAAAKLQAAVEARTRAEIDEAMAIAELAAEHEWPVDAPVGVIGTRAVRLGADGTPMHDEFVALEVAVAMGISVSAATWLVRDVVNLKARHPLVWFHATRGLIPMFRARQLTMELRTTQRVEQLKHVPFTFSNLSDKQLE